MNKQISKRVPDVKSWEGMSIINNLLYHKEQLKIETSIPKRKFHKKRLEELKIELENHKAA